jgi:two-component system OmpR family response regulator
MRILVAEDDAVLAEGVMRTLRQSGHAVDWVKNGAEADCALAANPFDLLILDLGLPKRSGLDVLKHLRAGDSRLPVLILTALDGVRDRVRGLDAGADDYLVKPFELAELEARVRALIRRSQAVRSPKLRFGGLTVDTVARRASIGAEPLDLTPREWAVLEYLLMRIGQVVSKEHMLQAMCSWDDSLTHNAVEVYISRLRSKLQHAGIRIRTVRGFGYMVEDPDTAETGTPVPAAADRPGMR